MIKQISITGCRFDKQDWTRRVLFYSCSNLMWGPPLGWCKWREEKTLFTFFSSGLTLGKLKEKAFHALFSRRKHTNIRKLFLFLAIKIFDTMISPILIYNSEIWDICSKPNFKSWDSSQIKIKGLYEPTHSCFSNKIMAHLQAMARLANHKHLLWK